MIRPWRPADYRNFAIGHALTAERQIVGLSQMPDALNPYAAPRTDTGQVPIGPSSRTGWKVYAYSIVVLNILGFFYIVQKIDVAYATDYAVSVVGMIGLFGFAYRRPLFWRWTWALWSVLLPVGDLVMAVWGYPRLHGTAINGGTFVGLMLFLPEYLALFRYAHASRDLWARPAARGAI